MRPSLPLGIFQKFAAITITNLSFHCTTLSNFRIYGHMLKFVTVFDLVFAHSMYLYTRWLTVRHLWLVRKSSETFCPRLYRPLIFGLHTCHACYTGNHDLAFRVNQVNLLVYAVCKHTVEAVLGFCDRIIVPPLGSAFLDLHSGHPGLEEVKSLVRRSFWGPVLDSDLWQVGKRYNNCEHTIRFQLYKWTLWTVACGTWQHARANYWNIFE